MGRYQPYQAEPVIEPRSPDVVRLHRFVKTIHGHIRFLRQHIGDGRLLRLGAAALMVFTLAIPAFQFMFDIKSYQLDAQSLNVIGKNNDNLVKKFTYDAQTDTWQFNKGGSAAKEAAMKASLPAGSKAAAGLAGAMAQMKAQVGGNGAKDDSLYSADLATDPTKGITYYDNNTDLSFSMVPQFKMRSGKLWQGRLVYPVNDTTKLVYTAKNNGMKEDIVLSKATADSMSFTYKLNLPKELEARINDDGSIGVYSADPSLFGDISYGSDADQAKIQSARETADKTHLVFAIPSPVLKDAKGIVQPATYHLDGNNNLTVQANNLNNLHYPLSIDPSVVITSTSDFASGNNEDGNIDYSTSGQIGTGKLTGGEIGAWATTGTSVPIRAQHASVAYNGYIYILGGYTNDGDSQTSYNDVWYAPLNTDGTMGTWATTTSFTNARLLSSAVAYNGYMYISGGFSNNTGTYYNDVQYAPINANGTVGTWQYTYNSASSASFTGGFTSTRQGLVAIAYNGYLYVIGGNNTGTYYNDVQYAPINANGTVGTWQYTYNSASSASFTGGFTSTRYGHNSLVYNGYLYVMGGANGNIFYNDVQYAPINANGTIGTWATTTSFVTARFSASAYVSNGYIYVLGGYSGGTYYGDVQYAPINANGTVGTWVTTTGLAAARSGLSTVVYNNFAYIIGGQNSARTSASFTTLYTSIKGAGYTGIWAAGTTLASNLGVSGGSMAVYNGYAYMVGGWNGSTYNNVQYASISSSGVIGTWTTTAGYGTNTSRYYARAVAYNGYLYVLGGTNGAGAYYGDIQYAPLNADGSISNGTWAATSSLSSARYAQYATAYNGYMYVIGGATTGGTAVATAESIGINGNGTLNGTTWTSGASFTNARSQMAGAVYAGYIYIFGGTGASIYADVQYASLNQTTGAVGTWTAANSFTTARYAFGSVITKGYVYIFGGYNGSNLNDVQYAQVKSDGSLGTWQTAPTMGLVTALQDYGYATYNGYIITAGGWNGSASQSTTRLVHINNGGDGTAGTWQYTYNGASSGTTGFGVSRAGMTTVAYNGYIYVIGGYDNTNSVYRNDLQYAAVNPNGTVGAWTTGSTMFSGARDFLGAVAYNGYLYIAGGYSGLNVDADVQYAPINASTGAIGAWQYTYNNASSGSFVGGYTTNRNSHKLVAYNGYMYIYGGRNDNSSVAYNDVQYAPINSNGTVGSWSTTTAMSHYRAEFGGFAYNGYLYALGGSDNAAGTYLNDVTFAPINSNGTIGTWSTTASFSIPRSGLSVVASNGYVYVLSGGAASFSAFGDAQYAAINSNGTIGNWTNTSVGTNENRTTAGLVIINGYMYEVGGGNLFNDFTDVQYAPLNSIARKATYSKLVDLGTTTAAAYVTYNGTMSEQSKVSFKTAGSSGVLGTANGGVAGAAPGSINSCSAAGVSRYAYLTVTLDDSQLATFGASPSASNLTDITVTYAISGRAAPNVRLHGGKFFASQVLNPLDICGA